MMLKLTDTTEDFVLVNTSNIKYMQKILDITRILWISSGGMLDVKETIEEITQQIKEGGIASEHYPTTS